MPADHPGTYVSLQVGGAGGGGEGWLDTRIARKVTHLALARAFHRPTSPLTLSAMLVRAQDCVSDATP